MPPAAASCTTPETKHALTSCRLLLSCAQQNPYLSSIPLSVLSGPSGPNCSSRGPTPGTRRRATSSSGVRAWWRCTATDGLSVIADAARSDVMLELTVGGGRQIIKFKSFTSKRVAMVCVRHLGITLKIKMAGSNKNQRLTRIIETCKC